jgi:hypothetical protein
MDVAERAKGGKDYSFSHEKFTEPRAVATGAYAQRWKET